MAPDTVADERRKKMAYGVTMSPARLCSRDGDIFYYGRLEHDLIAFVPLLTTFQISAALSRYVHLRRVPSSVQ